MKQEEIVGIISSKDSKAFDVLYDMYSQNLYGVIFNIIKNKEESEDLLQEVFVKIWSNLSSYNSNKGRFFTWIVNIARNAAIDRYRSKNFKTSKQNLSTENFVDIIEQNTNVMGKLDAIGISKFINKLKPKCIKLIDLLFFKGFTHKEASEELDIPIGTVKTQNRMCLSNLRTLLEI